MGLLTLVFGIMWAMFLATQHDWIHEYSESAKEASLSGYAHADEGGHNGESEASEDGGVTGKPLGEVVHERLRRGHIHAMGLGLLAIVVSFVFAFTQAPARVKSFGSAMVGAGCLVYPFSWILMGLRTPALGPVAAEGSVIIIVGPCLLLILGSIALATVYLFKTVVSPATVDS